MFLRKCSFKSDPDSEHFSASSTAIHLLVLKEKITKRGNSFEIVTTTQHLA